MKKNQWKKGKSDGIIEHTKAKERKTTHNNTKEEKCGQFATSGLLHALTITLFRRPPSAYPSCSGLSLQLLLSFWVRAWKTNPKHSGLIWRCLWEEAKKDRTKGSNPPLSSEFMISILAMCIFFFSFWKDAVNFVLFSLHLLERFQGFPTDLSWIVSIFYFMLFLSWGSPLMNVLSYILYWTGVGTNNFFFLFLFFSSMIFFPGWQTFSFFIIHTIVSRPIPTT